MQEGLHIIINQGNDHEVHVCNFVDIWLPDVIGWQSADWYHLNSHPVTRTVQSILNCMSKQLLSLKNPEICKQLRLRGVA